MDIEYQVTPPKKNVNRVIDEYNTPNRNQNNNPESKRGNGHRQEYKYQSPRQSRTQMVEQNQNSIHSFGLSTPPSSNKLLKEFKNQYKNSKSSYKKQLSLSNKKISQFSLSRLDQDYQVLKTLGQGCFSSVQLCRSRLTDDLVAIKETKDSSMSVNEVQALGTLSIFAEKSKNIVKYYHSWSQDGCFYIVMEYCECNLTDFYKQFKKSRNSKIPQSQLKKHLKEALQGLRCMHQNRMVHLDIKPDNLLFKNLEKNSKDSGKTQKILKIADLGLCRVSRIKKWSQLDQGDSRYLAQQILNFHEGIDLTKADIFSLGMAFFQGMSLIGLPNNGQQWLSIRQKGINFNETINTKTRQSVRNSYSKELVQIVQLMTCSDWRDRPSAASLLQMDYFRQSAHKQQRINNFFGNGYGKSKKNVKVRDSSL